MWQKLMDRRVQLPLLFSAVVATTATLGSLFFSNVLGYVPCELCWLQRICMYPLVPLFFTALIVGDPKVYRYAFTPVVAGLGISLFHNIIYYRANFGPHPTVFTACTLQGSSCTVKYIEWYGFVTIPLLSAAAFLLILGGLVVMRRMHQRNLS